MVRGPKDSKEQQVEDQNEKGTLEKKIEDLTAENKLLKTQHEKEIERLEKIQKDQQEKYAKELNELTLTTKNIN